MIINARQNAYISVTADYGGSYLTLIATEEYIYTHYLNVNWPCQEINILNNFIFNTFYTE